MRWAKCAGMGSVVAGELEIDGIRRSELRDGQLDRTPPMRIAIAVAESIIIESRA